MSRDERIAARLRAAGCVFAEDEAALLAAEVTGPALEDLVRRRVAGEPLEYLLGWAEFCGRRVHVTPGVFVPRRRTEVLVRAARQRAPAAPVVVELCCGAAAVAAVLADGLPGADVHAADVDPAAVTCARRNVARGRVYEGDLYAALPDELRGRVDLLVANAPYVPSGEVALMPREAREFEPPVALDGGSDGLELHRRIAGDAPAWLAPTGWLLIETSERQAEATCDIVAAAGLIPEVVRADDVDGTAVAARPGDGSPLG